MRKITILGLFILIASFTFGQVTNLPGIQTARRSEKMAIGTASHKQHLPASKSTFLMEDFENNATTAPYLPVGWTNQVVDANSVNAAYASYWPTGWTGQIYISGTTNHFASSCSYFQTPGTADRWLFSPAITISSSGVLTWDAMSIDFGFQANSGETYDVFVTNTIAGTAPRASDFPISTRVFTTGATPELQDWTSHTANITYSTGTIYVAFRHTSNYKQVLAIDNIRVGSAIQNDLVIDEVYLYTNWWGFAGLVPKKQVDTVYFGGKYTNVGAAAQTNCVLNVKVSDGTSDVFTGSTTPTASLAPGAFDSLYFDNFFVPSAIVKDFTVSYNATQTQTEETPDNNKDTLNFSITDSVFSRTMYYTTTSDITNWERQTGDIQGGSGMSIGNNYYFNTADTVTKISMALWNGTTANVLLTGKIYLIDQATGDRSEVASSPVTVTTAINGATRPQIMELRLTTPYSVPANAAISAVVEVSYSPGDTLIYITDATSPNDGGSTFFFPLSGKWYTITNDFPCVDVTTFGGAPAPHAVNNNNALNFSIYPNPANNNLTVNLKNNQTSLVEIYNMLGSVVASFNTNGLTNNVDISNLNAGVYTVKVSQNGQSTAQKFVKQ